MRWFVLFVLAAAAVGCQKTAPPPVADTSGLAELSAEDRPLAEAQKACPVAGKPLGSMGKPVKLTLRGQPVFLCCAACTKKAEADPAATLGKVGK